MGGGSVPAQVSGLSQLSVLEVGVELRTDGTVSSDDPICTEHFRLGDKVILCKLLSTCVLVFKALSTCTVEQVRSLQDVSVPDKGFSVVPVQEGFSCLVHLTVLHHLQPLTVVPAELLCLDLLAPLLVIFLRTGGRKQVG